MSCWFGEKKWRPQFSDVMKLKHADVVLPMLSLLLYMSWKLILGETLTALRLWMNMRLIFFFEKLLKWVKKNPNHRRIYHRPTPMSCINDMIAHTKRHRHKSVFLISKLRYAIKKCTRVYKTCKCYLTDLDQKSQHGLQRREWTRLTSWKNPYWVDLYI